MGDAASLEPDVRRTLRTFDRHVPLEDDMPLASYAATGLVPQRIAAAVAGSLGVLALALAAIGVYGLMAFVVSSRTREFGVRVALGADGGRLVRLVVRQSLRLTSAGGLIGLGLAAIAAPSLASLLIGVPPLDPLTFGAAAGMLLVVGTLAAIMPARRAGRVDPVVALRGE